MSHQQSKTASSASLLRSWVAGLVVFSALALASPSSAQLLIMGRTDRSDVRYSVNHPDPEGTLRTITEREGGNWTVLLSSTRCGFASVWSAGNGGSDRRYFVSDGHSTSLEASIAARDKATAFAEGRRGWSAGIMRTGILNENRYTPNANWTRRFGENFVGLAPCARANRRGSAVGVRG